MASGIHKEVDAHILFLIIGLMCSLKSSGSDCGGGKPWDCWEWHCCGSVVAVAGASDSMHSRQNGSVLALSLGRSEQNENKINHSGSLMKWVSEEMVSVLLSVIICFLTNTGVSYTSQMLE